MPRHILDHLHALAARDPELPVMVHAGAEHSIGTLLDRSGALAAGIRAIVGPAREPLIAVAAAPGYERLVAMLGTWLAGAVYVPLEHDPAAPVERMNLILAATSPALLLHDAVSMETVRRASVPPSRLRAIADLKAIVPIRGTTPPVATLAYVIFTSGSTGTPKGVAMEHRTLARLLDSVLPRLPAGRRTLQLVPATFDMSMKEVLGTLAGGGTLLLHDEVDPRDPETVLAAVRSTGANTLFLTPTGLQSLRLLPRFGEHLATHDLHVVCGGEQLTLDSGWSAGGLSLDNHYGPTESHVVAGHQLGVQEEGHIPIGVPMSGTDIYLLDDDLRSVGSGLVGEMWIGGDSLARAYLDRPDLTAERFLPDPFAERSGSRMYRSGDVGRRNADGDLSVVGRVDDQVKIRGYRVEPAEVAAALRAHPAVRVAHVAGRALEDHAETTLIGWLQGDRTHDDNLRGFLRRLLPAYMVPGYFLWVDQLPTTRNGKVDTRRLPSPANRRPVTSSAYAEPVSALERAFAAVWASELGLDKVGRDDNFFDLGGHSLQAVRLVFRLRDDLGFEVPVHALYEAPTIAMLTNYSSVAKPSSIPAVPRVPDGEYLPSFGQRRMWLYQTTHPASATYNLALVMRLRGGFDSDLFHLALQEMARRTEVLRTGIKTTADGQPVQQICAQVTIDLTRVPTVGTSEQERLAHAVRSGEAAASIPFDLSRPPLLRAYHSVLGPTDHVVIMVVHHAVMDGWSVDQFARETSANYAALAEGHGPLPANPTQYLDYSAWQRERVGSGGRSLDYWRSTLSGAEQRPLIPVAGHGAEDAHGRLVRFGIARPRVARLSRMAAAHGTTGFVLMLALYQRALRSWSDNDDVRIGVPVSGRTHAETARLIGYLSNTVVMRSAFVDGESFAETITRAKETVNEAFLHQEVPYDLVVEACRPERAAGSSGRLFQASMAFASDDRQSTEWHLGTGTPQFLPIASRGTQFPITLFVRWSSDGEVELRLLWNERLLSDARATDLRRILLSAVDEALGEGSVATPVRVPPPRTVIEALLRTATEWPERVFLEQPGEPAVTYRDAVRQVEAVAGRLRRSGVDRGDVVAVELPRGARQVLAMLGVMRAGAIYLPLDPAHPVARRDAMLVDAGAVVAIGRSVAATGPGPVRRLDVDAIRLPVPLGDLPPVPVPADVAYALYTSGSTGEPKAALITHAGLASLLVGQQPLDLVSGYRILAYAAPTFDAAVWELLLTLGGQGTLVAADDASRLDAAALDEFLIAHRIDVALLTPTVLRTLADRLVWRGTVISGGEALDLELAARLRDFVAAGRLWNAYGPTEASIVSTLRRVSVADLRARTAIPIGTPIDSAVARIVDADGRDAPPGRSGELCVSGPLVGAGYLGRPALTAERFVPGPAGRRSYRTGDLVRRLGGGELEYLGRLDDQVKLHGQRIEPAEIETALRGHPGVADAAVVLQRLGATARLVACYVVSGMVVEPDALRSHLIRLLPKAMVAATIVRVDSLPTLTSGKLDRAALGRQLAGGRPASPPAVVRSAAPAIAEVSAELPRVLQAWSGVLDGRPVRAEDNFFALGGSSLDLVRVATATSTALGREVTVRDLLVDQTPATLLHALRSARLGRTGSRELLAADPAAPARVVFVPPLSGELSGYAGLIRELSGAAQLEGVTLGRTTAGTLTEAAVRIAGDLLDPGDPRPVRLVGWSLAASLAYEIARAVGRSGIAAGVTVLDGHLPGSAEYELGAYVLAQRFESLHPQAGPLPDWLERTGLGPADLAAAADDWTATMAHWAWRLRSVGSHRPTGPLGDCAVILAGAGKPAGELDLMTARWRRTCPAARVTVLAADHRHLLSQHTAELGAGLRDRVFRAAEAPQRVAAALSDEVSTR